MGAQLFGSHAFEGNVSVNLRPSCAVIEKPAYVGFDSVQIGVGFNPRHDLHPCEHRWGQQQENEKGDGFSHATIMDKTGLVFNPAGD